MRLSGCFLEIIVILLFGSALIMSEYRMWTLNILVLVERGPGVATPTTSRIAGSTPSAMLLPSVEIERLRIKRVACLFEFVPRQTESVIVFGRLEMIFDTIASSSNV